MAKRIKRKEAKAIVRGRLPTQKLISHNTKISEAFEKVVEVMAVRAGETLIRQGAADDDLYFILAGAFEIRKNNRPTAIRSAGCHVGEIEVPQI